MGFQVAMTMIVLACLMGEKVSFSQDVKPPCDPYRDIKKVKESLRLKLKEETPSVRKNCGFPGEDFSVCKSCSDDSSEEMMNVIRPMLASKSHREWHAGWHQNRSLARFGSPADLKKLKAEGWIEGDTEEFKKLHTTLGAMAGLFGPPIATAPLSERQPTGQAAKAGANANGHVSKSVSGEDFFFMHREMMKMTNLELAENGKPCIAPWVNLPLSSSDPLWPVPKKGNDPLAAFLGMSASPEKQLEQLRLVDKRLKDPQFLKGISLSELGDQVESGIHNQLHGLYSGGSKEGCSHGPQENNVKCDNLGDPRQAPVNKYFWKIHGLVDGYVGAWLTANGYKYISTDCGHKPFCYQWKGTWMGKTPAGFCDGNKDDDMDMRTMHHESDPTSSH